MGIGELIALLSKNTAQLADWQFKEIVIEKVNEIISVVNSIGNKILIEESEKKPTSKKDKKAEESEAEINDAKARAEEERAAKELESQNAGK